MSGYNGSKRVFHDKVYRLVLLITPCTTCTPKTQKHVSS